MPSKSKSQQRLMRAAEHTPGGYDGVSQKVGKDFDAADKARGKKHLPERVGHDPHFGVRHGVHPPIKK